MSDKPHEMAVRSPDGNWFMVEDFVDQAWEVRVGPHDEWESPPCARSGQWVEARPRPSEGAS